MTGGENYPLVESEDGSDAVYNVDHVVVANPGRNYSPDDVISDDKGNVYNAFLDLDGRILNVIPPNPALSNLEPVTDLPELTIQTSTGSGAVLKAQISSRPEYQGEIKQVIDCISPRDGIVGYVNGEAYYGPFHVMSNGVKMTGVKHSDNDIIIYDTPQQSRTSTATISQTNVSNTTTQTTTSSTTQTNTTNNTSQQTIGQSNTSVPDNTSSDSGSSRSGGSYSGY